MKVTLIGYSTPNITQTYSEEDSPDKVVYTALAQCYNDSFNPMNKQYPEVETMKKTIKHVLSSGHHSVAEHVSFTFLIEGVSRALTHQLVRHRIASYSQKSQRYVNEKNFTYVTPYTIQKNKFLNETYNNFMNNIMEFYTRLTNNGIPAEDARFILPNACTTNIVMTMNIRSLGEFFAKRMCKRAQWEIREMAEKMSSMCRDIAPTFFKDNKLGFAACIQNGFCKEAKSCGMMPKLSDLQNAYKIVENSKKEMEEKFSV
jgi:thymidylate synthase (FAD)